MDVSILISLLFKLIDEISDIGQNRKDKFVKQEIELNKLYDEVSTLIDKYRETVVDILKLLEKVYPNASIYEHSRISYAEFAELNRGLYDAQSEMRIIIGKISNKLTEKGQEELKPFADICFQIVDLEGMIGIELATQAHVSQLPFPPEFTSELYSSGTQIRPTLKLPFDTADMDKYVLGMCIYFNSLLLKLQNCKENLAKAISYRESSEKRRSA